MDHLLDEAALHRTAVVYALGADRRDEAMWRSVLADDCVIEAADFTLAGIDQCVGSLAMLGTMFRTTQHRIHQQLAVVDGDRATGETYCTADHLLVDADAILSWAIRYQDSWRREGQGWRFKHRKLIVDWQETRPVSPDQMTTG
ncbi:MAG: nuclear transport factor 2 family protein [Erythrobacter sp.]|nr:nuclear transport factor 2 family protein [Erythrobacter sp.]